MKRRALMVASLFASTAAVAGRLSMRAGRSGAPVPSPPPAAPLEDVPGPAGAASMTVNFGQLAAGADGIVLYYGTTSRFSDDAAGYPYRKVVAGSSLSSVTVAGLAAGTYYCRPAGYVGTTVGDLSGGQLTKVAA